MHNGLLILKCLKDASFSGSDDLLTQFHSGSWTYIFFNFAQISNVAFCIYIILIGQLCFCDWCLKACRLFFSYIYLGFDGRFRDFNVSLFLHQKHHNHYLSCVMLIWSKDESHIPSNSKFSNVSKFVTVKNRLCHCSSRGNQYPSAPDHP